jgi:hypothetical protein
VNVKTKIASLNPGQVGVSYHVVSGFSMTEDVLTLVILNLNPGETS